MNKSKVFLIVFAAILINGFHEIACASQGNRVNELRVQYPKELHLKLESTLKDMHVPGMSVAIVHKDGPLWIAGLGKADVAHDVKATEKTLFRIGSVSKGFISLAILKLVDERKLLLDDPIKKIVPEVWFGNTWEACEPIRIVHLLENTTGWDDMHLCEFAKNSITMSSLDALNYGRNSRISRWRPGTRMSYSNSGPAVAAYIVEKITGKSFEEYVRQNFFEPMGMQSATYLQPDGQLSATVYHYDGKTPYPYWNLLYRSIGSLNASAMDMANYLLFFLNRGAAQGIQMIQAALLTRMEVPSSTWSAKVGLPVGYGLNNYFTIRDGFIYHGHDGNIPGSLTALQYLPNEGIGYFFSINSDNRDAFDKIDAIIREYITRHLQKPPVSSAVSTSQEAQVYAGWYEPNSPRVQLFFFAERLMGIAYVDIEDDKLVINSLSERNATFLPTCDTQFRYIPKNECEDPLPTLTLLTNGEGQFIQRSLGLRNPSLLHVTLKRIPAWLAMLEIIDRYFCVAGPYGTLVMFAILAFSIPA